MIDKRLEAERPYQEYLSKLKEEFVTYMERDKNRFADTLAFMAKIDCQNRIQPQSIDVRNYVAYYYLVEKQVDGNLWFHDIKWFIQHQEYPQETSSTDMKTL